jgi:hypothetical protein
MYSQLPCARYLAPGCAACHMGKKVLDISRGPINVVHINISEHTCNRAAIKLLCLYTMRLLLSTCQVCLMANSPCLPANQHLSCCSDCCNACSLLRWLLSSSAKGLLARCWAKRSRQSEGGSQLDKLPDAAATVSIIVAPILLRTSSANSTHWSIR